MEETEPETANIEFEQSANEEWTYATGLAEQLGPAYVDSTTKHHDIDESIIQINITQIISLNAIIKIQPDLCKKSGF